MAPRPSLASVVSFLCLAVVACSNDDGGTASTTPPAAQTTVSGAATSAPQQTDSAGTTQAPLETSPSDAVGCRVKISGDVTAEFTAKDDLSAFGSDYYLSDAEIEQALGFFSDSETTGETEVTAVQDEEPDFTAPPRAEGSAPLVSWFLLNCQGGDITISFYSNPDSTRDDVPFGSGKYTIAPGSGFEADDPKEFSALIAFGANPSTTVWLVDEGAYIDIERFDDTGAKGTFEIPMVGAAASGEELRIEGEFEVTCKDGANCAIGS